MKNKKMNLNGKTALVTGASGGIGSAIAQKLSAANCTVALAGRNLERLEEVQQSLLNDSIIVEMDVSQSNNVAAGFEKTLKEFGKIDILVNAAGVMPLTYLKNRHLDEWLETIEVNVKGTLRCVHEVLPSMKDQKAGHIVNIASVDGQEILQGGAVYGASKAAVIELSRAMRMELSPEFNIRVTSIEPGTVDTDLREDITDEELLEDKDYGGDEAKMSTEDIADAVYYALSQPNSVNVNELMLKPTGKS
ncbi:3-oxoacyl-[acyl-carrier protein] reductase [Christiangramia flava JLT2011]|uniref:3-oxoacyl-[acyl-carrier protein] reductase n=2 Tax=Christiangramia TaxID=292691 RepID=A0A1L7I8Z5_9FLAO|nr:SDR family oxidoreductase [Christiangramia flava]APU70081.1 3-oxoacyl-[acyl-carrier protein] reductase [Christiangramia flava JLT2011]OSS39566.1 3-oxoacyl-[acyl-carrier protein] reductase [Christiangramia flava JLT2011]